MTNINWKVFKSDPFTNEERAYNSLLDKINEFISDLEAVKNSDTTYIDIINIESKVELDYKIVSPTTGVRVDKYIVYIRVYYAVKEKPKVQKPPIKLPWYKRLFKKHKKE